MNAVLQTIENRRSNGYVLPQSVKDEDLQVILKAACWAPTHMKTQPWHFKVFKDAGLKKLEALFVESIQAQQQELDAETYALRLEKAQSVTSRAPVIIAVCCLPNRHPVKNPPVWEDEAATAAAVQNMLLAAESLDMGGFWRTGFFTELDLVREAFDLQDKDRIMGYIYLGYKDKTQASPIRPEPEYSSRVTFITE